MTNRNSGLNRTRQSGIALVISLLMSLLIMTMAGLLNFQVQTAISTVTLSKEAISSKIDLDSVSELVLYNQVGKSPRSGAIDVTDLVGGDVKESFSNVAIEVRNFNSLLSVIPFRAREWEMALIHAGADTPDAIVAKLLDWIDLDDANRVSGGETGFYQSQYGLPDFPFNRAMQTSAELFLIPGFSEQVWDTLSENLVMVGVEDRNLVHAPDWLVSAYLSTAELREIREMREGSRDSWGEQVRFYASKGLPAYVSPLQSSKARIRVATTLEGGMIRQGFDVDFSRGLVMPFSISSWR